MLGKPLAGEYGTGRFKYSIDDVEAGGLAVDE
jgi:hypothetical protein